MNKFLLIGSMPPPIGGVTIYIDRFLNFYDDEKYQIAVFDIKKRKLFKKEKYTKNIFTIFFYYITARIIHIHIIENNYGIILNNILDLKSNILQLFEFKNSKYYNGANINDLFNK